jgi:glycerophosphoryl diester phosphodiesterase
VGVPGLASITIADNDLAVVTVTATDPDASEAGPTTGTFTFSRTGDTSSSLLISFTRGGTAVTSNVGPQDYASVGSNLTFPAGQASVDVTLTPLQDNVAEGNETVILTITPSLTYNVGSPNPPQSRLPTIRRS